MQEKARKRGNVVEATLQKHHTVRDKNGFPSSREMGIYTYQVKGKNYKYHYVTSGRLPKTITLLYLKKPGKATVGGDLGTWESPWFKIYLIIALIAAIIGAIVMGMIL